MDRSGRGTQIRVLGFQDPSVRPGKPWQTPPGHVTLYLARQDNFGAGMVSPNLLISLAQIHTRGNSHAYNSPGRASVHFPTIHQVLSRFGRLFTIHGRV